MLRVEDLFSGYGKLTVLMGVSLTVASKEFVSVIGPNGAGKTTLLETIMGLIPASGGQVLYAGGNISRQSSHAIVRSGIALVPQGRRIFAPLSVDRNLELGALAAGHGLTHRTTRQQLNLVYDLFPRLAERRGQRAGTMSGGEQQMLAIGRALMSNPTLLLLDEPSLGLAPKLVTEIFAVIARLRHQGLTIVLVEQNVPLALAHASRIYVLNVGRIVAQDTAEGLRANTTLRDLYLGGEANPEHQT